MRAKKTPKNIFCGTPCVKKTNPTLGLEWPRDLWGPQFLSDWRLISPKLEIKYFVLLFFCSFYCSFYLQKERLGWCTANIFARIFLKKIMFTNLLYTKYIFVFWRRYLFSILNSHFAFLFFWIWIISISAKVVIYIFCIPGLWPIMSSTSSQNLNIRIRENTNAELSSECIWFTDIAYIVRADPMGNKKKSISYPKNWKTLTAAMKTTYLLTQRLIWIWPTCWPSRRRPTY